MKRNLSQLQIISQSRFLPEPIKVIQPNLENYSDFVLQHPETFRIIDELQDFGQKGKMMNILSVNCMCCANQQYVLIFQKYLLEASNVLANILEQMKTWGFKYDQSTEDLITYPLQTLINLLVEQIPLDNRILDLYLQQIQQLEFFVVKIMNRSSIYLQLSIKFQQLSNQLAKTPINPLILQQQFELYPSTNLALALYRVLDDESFLFFQYPQLTLQQIYENFDLNFETVLKIITMIDIYSMSQSYEKYLGPVLEFLGVNTQALKDFGPDEMDSLKQRIQSFSGEPKENEYSLILEKIMAKPFLLKLQKYEIEAMTLTIIHQCQLQCGCSINILQFYDHSTHESSQLTQEYLFEEENEFDRERLSFE